VGVALSDRVRVSDRVRPGLEIKGPVGTGEPLVVRSPWDHAAVATINTTRLEEVDEVIDKAVAAAREFRWSRRGGARRYSSAPPICSTTTPRRSRA